MEEGKRTILVVDDSAINRELIKEIFKENYCVLEAENGVTALEIIDKSKGFLAAVLLDIVMPEMDGYHVLEQLNERKLLERIPVIMITADTSADAERTSYQKGAIDVICKPFDAFIVRQRVNRTIELFDSKKHLEERVNEQTRVLRKQYIVLKKQEEKLRENNRRIIDTICTIVEFRNLESGNHLKRIKGFTRVLTISAMRLFPEYELTPHKVEVISEASAMHDIGKIAIPDSILLKPGKLTSEEFEIMKSHTTRGCEVIDSISGLQDEEYYKYSYDICRHHHERYDGKGYPDHLKGEDISIAAQVTAVADVYDALISERIYKAAYSLSKAFDMIVGGECGTFSPKVLTCLSAARNEMEELFRNTHDNDIDNEDAEDS